MAFRKCTRTEMMEAGVGSSHKMDELYATADEISIMLGSPEGESPDGKVDAEWIAVNDDGEFINLWNYKDAGYLGIEFDPAAYRNFSVWYTDKSALIELHTAISRQRNGMSY